MSTYAGIDTRRAHDSTHGDATSNPFGQAQHVRRKVMMLAGKESTSTTEAGLHFVNDEKHPPVIA